MSPPTGPATDPGSDSRKDQGPLCQRVFQRLDDQRFQSGEALAEVLGVTRAAVWKAVEQLRELGVALDAQTNRGYRLANGVTALVPGRIEALLSGEIRERIEALIVDWTLESTNTRLLESFAPTAGKAAVVLAEHQTGGRGRRGRPWFAPPGGSLCISVAWQYLDMPADLSALSLVVGLGALNALREFGISDVQLKWPNDLVTDQGKLGGILIEMRAEAGGPVHVVVGVGLNVILDDATRAAVAAMGITADDIRVHRAAVPDRNAIAAALLARLVPALESFPFAGLAPHLASWGESDALLDCEVHVENLGEITRGVARGVDSHGALLVETPEGLRRFISGEVTVRLER
jgi:BirA family transcriptional regulator, biotin operon repressor / biotin---[acetyl-CoA-carboxylase] ligase